VIVLNFDAMPGASIHPISVSCSRGNSHALSGFDNRQPLKSSQSYKFRTGNIVKRQIFKRLNDNQGNLIDRLLSRLVEINRNSLQASTMSYGGSLITLHGDAGTGSKNGCCTARNQGKTAPAWVWTVPWLQLR
jgi:hypothetical protein